ncbi:MAG: NUDIX hydrolase [Chloroflexi bacterium]|nr:NUDIX hydrolase [Chloroflexota bacterium]
MSEIVPWKILSHVIAYKGRFHVVEDLALTPHGEVRYSFIHSLAEVVATLAFTPDDKVVLIHEYWHPLKRVIYDLPSGSAKTGETLEDAARRELEEETGWVAGPLEKLGYLVAYPNAINAGVHLFITHVAQQVTRHPNRFEFGEPVELDWETLVLQVLSGAYDDAALQLAVLLALKRMPLNGKHGG